MNTATKRGTYPQFFIGGVLTALLAWGCSIDDRKVREIGESVDGGDDGSGGKAPGAGGTSNGGKGSGGRAQAGGPANGGSGPNPGNGGSGARPPGAGGAGPNPGSGGGAGSDLVTSLATLVVTQCSRLEECAPYLFNRNYADPSDCQNRLALIRAWEATLPDTAFTRPNVDACTSVLQSATCKVFLSAVPPKECAKPGARALKAPCNSREQCASRFCATTGYECGTCAAAPGPGAACSTDNDCAEGTICTTLGTCQLLGPVGATCSAAKPCGYSLNCSAAGTCTVAPAAVGAACNSAAGNECDFVAKELVCKQTTSTCIKITPSDSCSVPATYCVAGGTCTAGNCVPPPGDTDACDPTNNQDCQFPALCVDGFCELPADTPPCASAPSR
jgi:hypothetical protein